jgi:hypothetical protein
VRSCDPKSALELNLGHRISLLAHLSFTGTKPNPLTGSNEIDAHQPNEYTQIFLVHTNYTSYNQSTTSHLPSDKIRANSNGEKSRLRYLGIDFLSPPLRPGKLWPLHQNSETEARNIGVNSSQQYALGKNKKNPFTRTHVLTRATPI